MKAFFRELPREEEITREQLEDAVRTLKDILDGKKKTLDNITLTLAWTLLHMKPFHAVKRGQQLLVAVQEEICRRCDPTKPTAKTLLKYFGVEYDVFDEFLETGWKNVLDAVGKREFLHFSAGSVVMHVKPTAFNATVQEKVRAAAVQIKAVEPRGQMEEIVKCLEKPQEPQRFTPQDLQKFLTKWIPGTYVKKVQRHEKHVSWYMGTTKSGRTCPISGRFHNGNGGYVRLFQGDNMLIFRCHSQHCRGRTVRMPLPELS